MNFGWAQSGLLLLSSLSVSGITCWCDLQPEMLFMLNVWLVAKQKNCWGPGDAILFKDVKRRLNRKKTREFCSQNVYEETKPGWMLQQLSIGYFSVFSSSRAVSCYCFQNCCLMHSI